jgi:hypothetical protein
MKIIKILLLISPFFISCSSMSKLKTDGCNENLKFKDKFFYNISIVEKYTIERTTVTKHIIETKAFLKSLKFISHYTNVSMEKVANYQIGYPTLEIFESDKSQWLKWYNANKCRNLK